MKLFAEGELRGHLDGLLHDMQRTIRAESKEQLLTSNEPDYIQYLVSSYRIEPPFLHESQIHVSAREQMIRADRFPGGFHVREDAAYSKQVINVPSPVFW